MDPLGWAIVFLTASAVLFVLEVFLPSGGLLGLGSAICIIAGVTSLFWVDPNLGMSATAISCVVVPAAVLFAIKIFPKTPIGRMMILSKRQALGRTIHFEPARDSNPQALVGATGEALTALRPVGICRINDQRLECLSTFGVIDPGTPVQVVSVNGIEIKVKPL